MGTLAIFDTAIVLDDHEIPVAFSHGLLRSQAKRLFSELLSFPYWSPLKSDLCSNAKLIFWEQELAGS
jgi:hypothetical protein